jgi:hypothetical protein
MAIGLKVIINQKDTIPGQGNINTLNLLRVHEEDISKEILVSMINIGPRMNNDKETITSTTKDSETKSTTTINMKNRITRRLNLKRD